MNSKLLPRCAAAAAVLCGGLSFSQTKVDLRSQSKSIDFGDSSYTRPVKVGTALAATCTTGELFFRSSAAPGSNLYACTATNTWTVLTGGSSITPGNPNTFLVSDGTATVWRQFSAGASGAVSMTFSPGATTVDVDTAVIPRKAVSETISGLWTFSQGILTPPMATPGSPAEGLLYIDNSTNMLKWYAGGAMHTTGGSGDTFGSSSTTVGQMATFADTTGKLLGKYTGSGVLKAASGVVSNVTGNASDCVKVDGSSGSCGSAGASIGPFTPQAPIALLRDQYSFTAVNWATGVAYNLTGEMITVPYSFIVGRLATSIQTAAASGSVWLGVYSVDGLTQHCEVQIDASTTGFKSGTCTPVTLPAGSYYLAWAASDAAIRFHGVSAAQVLEDGSNAGTSAMYFDASNSASAGGLPATLGTIAKSNIVLPIIFTVLAN